MIPTLNSNFLVLFGEVERLTTQMASTTTSPMRRQERSTVCFEAQATAPSGQEADQPLPTIQIRRGEFRRGGAPFQTGNKRQGKTQKEEIYEDSDKEAFDCGKVRW